MDQTNAKDETTAVASVATQPNTAPVAGEATDKVLTMEQARDAFYKRGEYSETKAAETSVDTKVDTTKTDAPPAVDAPKTYTEEEVAEARKQAEKEAKRRFISQVSLKDKELQEAKSNYEKLIASIERKEEGVSIKDAIEARFLAEKAEMELATERAREREKFFSENKDVSGDSEFEGFLTELRSQHPSITLDIAKKIYMAEKPDKFFKSEQGPMMVMGQVNPSVVVATKKEPTREELREAALAAFKK